MDQLPAEILHKICRLIHTNDIANFRLTCKRFSEIGAEYLFPEVFMCMAQRHFNNLTELSRQPHLAKGVKSLEYTPFTFAAPAHSLAEFEQANNILLPFVSPIGTYDKYVEFVEEHQTIQTTRVDYSTFLDTLSHFPKLKHVALFLDNASFHHVYSGKYSDRVQQYRYSVQLLARSSRKHLDTFLRAVSETGLKLQSLHVDNIEWRFFEHNDEASVKNLFAPLLDLQHLRLYIDQDCPDFWENWQDMDYHACRTLMRTGVIRKSIQSLKQLHSLSVEFSFWDHDDMDPQRTARLLDIVPARFTWPFLKTLRLRHIDTDRHELMEVLLQYQDTLRELYLEDIFLRTTSWVLLLPDIRRALYLTDPCVCGITEGYEEGVEDEKPLQLWYIYDEPQRGRQRYLAIRIYLLKQGTTTPGMECPLTVDNTDQPVWDDLNHG
ncbi:hypothetical protein F4779DRAFT_640373 [Xylariaceae sp. FL0662B]|nr:hypothetical protein F4779DRAFT_640373 [Xylariaceae sp. FL0662B]